jgi:hypothetical protein
VARESVEFKEIFREWKLVELSASHKPQDELPPDGIDEKAEERDLRSLSSA